MRYRLYRARILLRRFIAAIITGTTGSGYVFAAGRRRPYYRKDQRIIIDPVRHVQRPGSGKAKRRQNQPDGKRKKKNA